MTEDSKRLAQLETRVTYLERDFKNMEKKLDKIDGNINKLMWLIISTIVLAIVNQIMKGGIL